jgi:bile acid:Na+ symporter, BASS family
VLVITPIVAVLLARTFDIPQVAEIALVALAISPLPPMLPQKELKAGDHHSYGLALMAIMAILAIVTVPLSAEILQRVFNRPLGASSLAIARMVLNAAVLPLLAGMAVRTLLPAAAERIDPIATLVGKVLMPVAVLALLVGMWRAIWGAIGGGTVVEMGVFVVLALAIGDLLGRPERDNSVVLALSSATRHPEAITQYVRRLLLSVTLPRDFDTSFTSSVCFRGEAADDGVNPSR